MNKVFKTIWNAVRRCLVVVNETKTSACQKGSKSGSTVNQNPAIQNDSTHLHLKHTFGVYSQLSVAIFSALLSIYPTADSFANSRYNINAGETVTLTGTSGNPGQTLYWHNVNNYGTLTVKGVSDGFGIQDAKGGHWNNLGVMYVYAYGINNSRNNEHDNSGILHLLDQNSLHSSGFRNHGSAQVYSVTKALLNVNETTRQVTDTTRFKAIHNNVKTELGLGTGQVRNVKEATVTGIKHGDMTFESASNKLIFTDVVAGSSTAQAILSALSAHGQYSKPTVSFTGSGNNAYGASGLTFTELNLAAAQDAKNKGYAGAIFYNDALKLGGGAKNLSDIGTHMGFKSIEGTLHANNGLKLTMTGANGAGYLMTGNNNVTGNSVLALGHTSVSSGGKLHTVTLNNGALSVDAGAFTIDSLKANNNAVVTVAKNATLNSAGLSGTFATWLVDGVANLTGGSMTLNGVSGSGTFTNTGATLSMAPDAIGMNMTNRGTLTLSGTNALANTINNAGTVNALQDLNFGTNGRFTQTGGTLNTIQDNVFENVKFSELDGLNTISLGAQLPETVKTTLNDLFQKYVPGNVTQEIIDHATFSGGKVVIQGVNLTTTMRDDLAQAFKDVFGSATQIEFQGTIQGTSKNDILNVAKVNELHTNVEDLRDVIYLDRNLEGEGTAVMAGGTGLQNSVGFAGINNATSTTIQDGKNIVLVGAKDNADYAMTASDTTVKAGSKLTIGSLGVEGFMGKLATLFTRGDDINHGAIDVVAGNYSTAGLDIMNGDVTIQDGAVFKSGTANLTGFSTVDNKGDLTLAALNAAGDDITFTNRKTLTVDGNTNIIGDFINEVGANASLKDVQVLGVLENKEQAFIEANLLKVRGTLNNSGEMEISDQSTLEGTLKNYGEIRLYNTDVGNRGVLNNTYTLTHTGIANVNGLLSNVEGAVANMETVVLSGTDAQLINQGQLFVDSLTVKDGAYYLNRATGLSTFGFARSTDPAFGAQQRVFDIAQGGIATNDGAAAYGSGTWEGTFNNTTNGWTVAGISTAIPDGTGITIAQTGIVNNGGRFVMAGAGINQGTIQGDGTLELRYDAMGTNVFENTGSISTGTFEADQVTFNQTAGSLVADAGWFTNSAVTLTGGTMASDTLGVGNTYQLGADGNVNGTARYDLKTLSSDSDITIGQGSVLAVETIAMTGDKTAHLMGGVLNTTLDQVFDGVFYNAHDLEATSPDDVVDILGAKIATSVGDVIDTVEAGIEFGWGSVVFNDLSFSTAMAKDALEKLDAIDTDPVGHERQLEVAFNGDLDGTANVQFTVDLANQVRAENADGSAYATFLHETLVNKTTNNPDATSLVVGLNDPVAGTRPTTGTPNVLETSIGFANVTGVTDGLFINNSSHFVLVGDSGENGLLDLADGTVWIGGADDGSTTYSRLTLGSYASAAPTKGHLAEVHVNQTPSGESRVGTLQVRHGEFTIDKLYTTGVVQVGGNGENYQEDHDAILHVGALELFVRGSVENDANVTINTVTSNNNGGSVKLLNRGVMTLGTADVLGNLENFSKVTADSLILRDSGSKNHAGASLVVTDFTIAGDTAWGDSGVNHGKLLNYGTLEATNTMTVEGTFANDGEAKAQDFTLAANASVENLVNGTLTTNNAVINGAVTNAGEYVIDGMGASLAVGGSIVNTGTITGNAKLTVAGGTLNNQATANLTGLEITSGAVTNAEGATITDSAKTTIAMGNTSDIAIDNQGLLTFADLDLQTGTITGGTVNATNAVIATGGLISNIVGDFGTLENSGLVNFNAGNVSALTNNTSGTINANGTVSLAGQNNGLISVAQNGQLVVNTATTLTNAGQLDGSGQTSVLGTLDNAGTATFTGEVTIGNGGRLNNTQSLSGQKVTIGNGGTLASAGNTVITELLAQTGSTIEVNGALTSVGNLVADNVTYNQTGGTIAADKGWFTNSVLNIMGGTLNASTIKDEAGNITGMLGHNTVNISGQNRFPNIDNDAPAADKVNWKDGLSVVTVDTITSDTTVNIMSGGVLDVDKIELTGENSITVAAGGLQTSLDQIFDWVKTQAIKIDATDPDTGIVQLPTTVLTSTTVGDVKDSIASGIDFESGMVAFDDDYFSASTIVSAGIQFGKAFDTTNTTLHFLGQMAEDFTVDTAADLVAEGLPEVLAGIVLDTTTLHNESQATGKDNTALVIGGTADGANSIAISMGFQNVANADSITIEGGKEFALVGYEKPEGFDWTVGYDDTTKLMVDAADGGTVTVNDGTFTFGSDGVRNPTVGWINAGTIGANGTLVAKNGEFALWDISNDGTINVQANAILHTNTLTNNNALNIAGSMTIDRLDNANGTVTNVGDLLLTATDDINGTINNGGNFTAEGAVTVSGNFTSDSDSTNTFDDLTVTGKLNNGGALTIVGEEGVTDDEFRLTVAAGGTLTNNGTLTNTSHDTSVLGHLINNGNAFYDDMTVQAGGVSDNTGYEKGDILTIAVDGTHSNSGVSIWNNVDVSGTFNNNAAEDGKGLVIGSDDQPGTLAIRTGGTFNNNGNLDATHVANTDVYGTLNNGEDGKAFYDDMTIHQGGVSDNAGYEKGDILHVTDGGTHTNTGTSIWNNVKVEGSVENGGDQKLEDMFEVAAGGDYTNNGNLDATGVEDTVIDGAITNGEDGKANYDDMTINAGGESVNNGHEKGDILDVGGNWTNNNKSEWNNVNIGTGGETHFGNGSETDIGNLVVDGGTLNVDGGTVNADTTELNHGFVVVGNDKPLSEDNKASLVLPGETDLGTNTFVIGNGNLVFGTDRDFAGAIGMPELPDHPSRVTVGSTVTVGETGSLAVGTGSYTDKDNYQDIGNGNLFFGHDSTTIIDIGALGEGPAFTTDFAGATVTVEDGATLILGNIDHVGDYTITTNFDTTGNLADTLWNGGWTEDNLYALPQDGTGLGWILDLNHNDNTIWVNAKLEDVLNVYPDIAIPDNVNDDLLHCDEAPGADGRLVCSVLRDPNASVADKTMVINSVAEIGILSGAMATAIDDMNSATGSVENRVSMVGEVFNTDGTMTRAKELEKGHGLWADVLGGKLKADGYKADGLAETGYENTSFGFIMGYDKLLANGTTIVGGALSVQKGDVESVGDVLMTKNDSMSYGVHGYVAYSPSPKLNVIGSVSYMNNQSDASQSIPLGEIREAKADMKTNLFTAGVRAESTIATKSGVKVIPHAGVRLVHADSGSFDTKLDGEQGFKNDTDAATLVQFPVGVAVRMDKTLDNGWTLRPQADLTVTGQVGDTEQAIKVTGTRGVSDTVEGQFAGDYTAQMSFGLQAQKDKTTIGVRYGATMGADGKQDHNAKVEVRFHF